MFDLMFGLGAIGGSERRLIEVTGDDPGRLLVAWLNEVLYVHAADRLVFRDFVDARLSDGRFSAWGVGEKLRPGPPPGRDGDKGRHLPPTGLREGRRRLDRANHLRRVRHRDVTQVVVKLEKVDDWRWRIPRTGGMRVPGMIYSDERLLRDISLDESPQQVVNVAHLPGIVKYSLAMPDMHWGYGFPIGGVAATDLETGVISPGGVGYDINCGCRLMSERPDAARTSQPMLRRLVRDLFNNIPSGVGSTGVIKLSAGEERQVLTEGAGVGGQERLRRARGPGADRGARRDGRSGPGCGERPRDHPGQGADRHAGLGQSLPRGRPGRGDLRPGGGRRLRARGGPRWR